MTQILNETYHTKKHSLFIWNSLISKYCISFSNPMNKEWVVQIILYNWKHKDI